MDVLEAVMPAAAFSRMPRPGMNIPPPVFPVAPPTTRTTSGGALAADAVTRALGPSPVPPSTGQVSVSDAMSRVLGDNTARALASDRDAAVGAQLAAGGKVRDDLIPRDLRPVVLGEVDGERPVINLSGGAAESMQSVIDNLSPEAANLLTSILIKTGSATRGAGPIEQTLVNDDPLMLLKKSQQELVDEAAANKNPVGKIPKGAPARHGHFTGDSIDADFMSLLDKRVDPGSPRIVDAMLAEEIRSALTAAGWRQDVRGDRPHWTYAPGRNQ